MGRLNSGNACYHSIYNPLSSHHLSKNTEIKLNIYNYLYLHICMGVKLGLSQCRVQDRLYLRTGHWGKYT
jgi:hypothetical protein